MHVPLLEVEVSAGGGGFDYVAEDTTAGWPFDRSLLGTIYDGAPDDLRLVIVRGESMTPLLEDGDMVLVNTANTQPSPPGIFVLFDGIGPFFLRPSGAARRAQEHRLLLLPSRLQACIGGLHQPTPLIR